MRKLVMLALVALLVPTASKAADALGLQVGLRVGYALAGGAAYQITGATEAAKMKDGMKSQIPLQLDVNYTVAKDIAAGVYFSYGIGQAGGLTKDGCDASGADCSLNDIRAGVQGVYSFSQLKAPVLPWAALNVGYERGSSKATLGPVEQKETASGFEVGLAVGADYKVEKFSVGPFLGVSMGQYTSVKYEETGSPAQTGGFDKKFHEFYQIGLRGAYSL